MNKAKIVVTGPCGCGKTYILETIKNYLQRHALFTEAKTVKRSAKETYPRSGKPRLDEMEITVGGTTWTFEEVESPGEASLSAAGPRSCGKSEIIEAVRNSLSTRTSYNSHIAWTFEEEEKVL